MTAVVPAAIGMAIAEALATPTEHVGPPEEPALVARLKNEVHEEEAR